MFETETLPFHRAFTVANRFPSLAHLSGADLSFRFRFEPWTMPFRDIRLQADEKV
jgi:hypothetical protein